MEQTDIKNAVKEAKEAIKNKDIEKALRLSKAVLKVDNTNYLGWVIFGAALQESDIKNQAPNAYRKAIQISPNQILAWQGLASYYEKEKENSIHDLLLVYKQLLLLEKDSNKKYDLCLKIVDIVKSISTTESIEEFSSLLDAQDENCLLIQGLLLKNFDNMEDIFVTCLPIYKKLLLAVAERSNESDVHVYIQKYLEVSHSLKEYEAITEIENQLSDKNNLDEKTLEILCHAFCQVSISQYQKCKNFRAEKYFDDLLKMNKSSINGLTSKAIVLYYSDDYVSSRDLFCRVIELEKKNWMALYYLSKLSIELFCFSDALLYISRARVTIPSGINYLSDALKTCYLQAASNSHDLEECKTCYNLCKEVLLSQPDDALSLKCLIYCAIKLSQLDSEEENFQKLESMNTASYAFLKAFSLSHNNRREEALAFLKNKIQENHLYIECWILMGKLYWQGEYWEDARNAFLRAAKLAPHIYVVFLHLGNYYRNITRDFDKARRCYEKAFQLNPKSEETGIALSEVYQILKLSEKNFELLSSAVEGNFGTWASFRLGLHHLDHGNAEAAVRCLRQCVRTDSGNSFYWEILGDACYASGSFNAALKCFQKSSSLNSTSIYPRLQVAVVKQKIGLTDESLEEVRALVDEDPTYLPALISLSEICLAHAKEQFHNQILSSVRNLCEEAALALTKVLAQKNRLIFVWKLLSDACFLVCQLPVSLSFMKLPSLLFKEKRDAARNDLSVVERDSLLEFSIRCCETNIYLIEDKKQLSSFLWHDIAICYNLRATYSKDENVRAQQRKLALVAAKTSVSKNPSVWEHWNLLGIIASSDEINNVGLAQHCFIKAIKLDDQNTEVWSNLGTLYFKFDDIGLANEAFRVAQRINPIYSRAWIGQALIAETVNHNETADLFYHSSMLGYHHESAKGFAEWICKILIEWHTFKEKQYCRYLVEHMFGLQVATVLQTWYTAHQPEDVASMNTMSVLFEMCKLHRSAVSASKHSLQHANEEQFDIVCLNLGRQLRKLGSYRDAVEVLKRIKNIDFIVQCELALCLCLCQDYEQSLMIYEAALQRLPSSKSNDFKGEIMVAMAALNYLRNQKQNAQTILLECTRLHGQCPQVHGLFAVCAFGMMNKQLMLSKLVLKELKSYKHESEYAHHVALFSTYCEVFQENFKSAINTMSKFLYERPGDARIWLSLGHLLLNLIAMSPREYRKYSLAAANHAKCAVTLGRRVLDISKIYSTISLSYLYAGKTEECLRSSLKAVFLYPNEAENWAVLIAAQYSRGSDYFSLLNNVKYVKEKLTCSKNLATWLSNVERKVTAIIG